jgi:hypothetical protein
LIEEKDENSATLDSTKEALPSFVKPCTSMVYQSKTLFGTGQKLFNGLS